MALYSQAILKFMLVLRIFMGGTTTTLHGLLGRVNLVKGLTQWAIAPPCKVEL